MSERQTDQKSDMKTSLDQAIASARYNIEVTQPAVVIESAWQACVITRRNDGEHSVYREDAFTPHTGSILPWSKPEGDPIARVELDGSVVML